MTMAINTEMEQLKAAHRVTWDSGDYSAVARELVQEVADVAVAAAQPQPGEEILDVATGSGNAAIPAAQAGARVTGLDIATTLLEAARRRADQAGVEVDLIDGDAEALPFEDASFDKALSVLGVQFTPRHELSAREIARVVRPGGAIVLANWTPRGFIGQFFKAIGPRMPKPPEGASPPPLWGDEDHVRRLFEGTGMELEFESHAVVFERESPEAFVAFMADVYGPLLKARERLEPEGRWDELHADLIALCERANLAAEGFVAPSEYLLVRGRKGGS